MKKNTRILIILSIVLVFCIGAYIGVSVYNADIAKKETAETDESLLYPPDWDAPSHILYETGGSTLSFTREDTLWYYDGDRNFPLKQSSLTSLSSTLSSLATIRTFDAPADLSDYGLVAPSYSVTSADSGGNRLTLLIGVMSGENYYVMKSGGDKVYTIDPSIVESLQPDILKMIALDTIPTLNETTIDTITLTDDTQSVMLDKYQARDGTYTWFVVDGTTYTSADDYVLSNGSNSAAANVTNVLSALGGLSFSSCAAFNPADDTLVSYGLAVPGVTVTVDYTTTDSNKKETSGTVVIEIGQMLADESGCYARLAGSDQINVLASDKTSSIVDALDAMGIAL